MAERFDEIQVEKLTVIGPDGTPRFVLANEDRVPMPVVDGQELNERVGAPRPAFLFYNQRGDEVGGLGASGDIVDGQVQAGTSFLFDQFRSDQILGLYYAEQAGQRSYGMVGWDRGDRPLTEYIERERAIEALSTDEEKSKARKELYADFPVAQRLFVGRTVDGDATVSLADTNGVPRLRLVVGSDDDPRIEFLDSEGKVAHRVPPATQDS